MSAVCRCSPFEKTVLLMREYRRPCADMQSLYKSVGRMDIMRMPQKRTKNRLSFYSENIQIYRKKKGNC